MVLGQGYEFLRLCWLSIEMGRFGKGNGRIEIGLNQASPFWDQMVDVSVQSIVEKI